MSPEDMSPEKKMPERLDLHVSLESIPGPLASAVENLAKPASTKKSLLKDYLPVLTPVAAVIISIAVSYSSCKFNKRASIDASSKTLSELIAEFGQKTEGSKGTWKNEDERQEEEQREAEQKEREGTIKAMKIAAYGDQALPAVKMALGADDEDLREGGVLVAQQMYRAATVDRETLTGDMLDYYDYPVLRRGVLEWLVKMDRQLSDEDSRTAFGKLAKSFGSNGQRCAEQDAGQDGRIAREAADFLLIWHFKDSRDLVFGLAKNCPAKFESARVQAVIALQRIASRDDKDSVVKDLQSLVPTASSRLAGKISNAVIEIQKIQ